MGWTYNTVNPNAPTDGPQIATTALVLTCLSLVIVSLRMYVRLVLIKAAGMDDAVIVLAWMATCGFAVITVSQTKWGLGLQSINDLPAENIYNFGLLQYIGAPFYITSILGFKLSLLLSYPRFTPSGTYRIVVTAVITATVAFHLCFLLVQINLCQPVAKQWDPTITTGSCLPSVAVYTSMASITMFFDALVMFLPFPMLVTLQIQTRKKLVLIGLFGMGIFITVIQIVRIQTIKQLVNYLDSAPLILWSTVENNLGIIVASVPPLAPLVKYFNEQSRNASSGQNRIYGNNPDSQYVMKSWGRGNRGQPLSSGHEDVGLGVHVVEGHVAKGDSTEFILEAGITRRTELVITSE